MLKFLNKDLFQIDEVTSSGETNYVDHMITPPECIIYDEEHPRPDKPFLKIREFACANESDRKLNVRGIITKTGIKTFRISSGDHNTGEDEDLFLLAVPFRGYLDETTIPEWLHILKSRIVISTKYTIELGDAHYSKMLWLVCMIDKDKLPEEDATLTLHYFYPERTRKKGTNNPERYPTGKTVYVDRPLAYADGEFTMKAEEPRVIEGEPERVKHPFPLYQFPDKECLRFNKPAKSFVKEEDGGRPRYNNNSRSKDGDSRNSNRNFNKGNGYNKNKRK